MKDRFVLSAFADEAGGSLDAQIAALRRNGIGLLEIRGVDGKNISDITPEEAGKIAEKLSAFGISVRSVGSPFGKQNILEDFGPHFDKFRRGLETARALGARYMRIFSFFMPREASQGIRYRDGGENVSESPCGPFFNEVAGRLERFYEEAEAAGILLCHENEKGIYGDVPERCVQIHRALPGIRAVFDPANYIQCGVDTLKAWSMIKPFAEYLHIKDCRPDGTVVASGYGAGNIAAILREFEGEMLTVEPHLAVFKGLEELERAGESSVIDGARFPSSDAAFDFAVNALKKILSEIDGEG
jgi:sugar phosphate isomerase/epimerase